VELHPGEELYGEGPGQPEESQVPLPERLPELELLCGLAGVFPAASQPHVLLLHLVQPAEGMMTHGAR